MSLKAPSDYSNRNAMGIFISLIPDLHATATIYRAAINGQKSFAILVPGRNSHSRSPSPSPSGSRRGSHCVGPSERLKIIDFGLARDISNSPHNSLPINMCGILQFLQQINVKKALVKSCSQASKSERTKRLLRENFRFRNFFHKTFCKKTFSTW